VAQDFTMALVGPQQRVAVLLASIDRRLSEAGLSRGSAVYQEDLDGDSHPDVEVPLSGRPVRDVIDKLIFWRAASMEFHRDALTVEIVIGQRAIGFTNCFLRTDLRSFIRLYQQKQQNAYFAAAVGVAESIAAMGGYGAVELPFDPLAPDQLISRINGGEEGSGGGADCALLLKEDTPRDRITELFGTMFEVRELGAYWLLESREFLALYPQLRA
jgi:hypothetical protein